MDHDIPPGLSVCPGFRAVRVGFPLCEDVGFHVDTPSGVPPIWLLMVVETSLDALSA